MEVSVTTIVPENHPENASVSSSLVQSAITHETEFSVSVFADMLELKAHQPHYPHMRSKPPKKSPRGSVTTFSRKSRKRMLEMMAKIRNPGKLIFITLTYTDNAWFGKSSNGRVLETHLDNICKWFEYNRPDCGIIWRKEWLPRKSGKHIGQIAPHLHLIIRGSNITSKADCESFHNLLQDAWGKITGEKSRVDVQIAHSRKHAYYYVSKYVAKPLTKDESYIREFFHNQNACVGRHWGVRGMWDFSPSLTVNISKNDAIQVKRFMRYWYRSRGQKSWAKRMAKIPAEYSLSGMGLGDGDGDLTSSVIFRVLVSLLE